MEMGNHMKSDPVSNGNNFIKIVAKGMEWLATSCRSENF